MALPINMPGGRARAARRADRLESRSLSVTREARDRLTASAPAIALRGLAMAETTPGPLIQVAQFVGFMAAYRDPGGLNPWVAAVLAACLVTWVT
jgi:chromate transporter